MNSGLEVSNTKPTKTGMNSGLKVSTKKPTETWETWDELGIKGEQCETH